MKQSYIWLIGGVLTICITFLFAAMTFGYLLYQWQTPVRNISPSQDKLITVSGRISCLPKIGDGPQTMECAQGLKTKENKHYALVNLFLIDPAGKYSDKDIEVTGSFYEKEQKGPDGNKYDIEGVIEISSIKEAITAGEPATSSQDIILRKLQKIESEYPEFADFENQQSFAGQSVDTIVDNSDHYFAFIVHGSGLPIVQATCFRVDRSFRVYITGNYPDPLDSYAGHRKVDPKACLGIK